MQKTELRKLTMQEIGDLRMRIMAAINMYKGKELAADKEHLSRQVEDIRLRCITEINRYFPGETIVLNRTDVKENPFEGFVAFEAGNDVTLQIIGAINGARATLKISRIRATIFILIYASLWCVGVYGATFVISPEYGKLVGIISGMIVSYAFLFPLTREWFQRKIYAWTWRKQGA